MKLPHSFAALSSRATSRHTPPLLIFTPRPSHSLNTQPSHRSLYHHVQHSPIQQLTRVSILPRPAHQTFRDTTPKLTAHARKFSSTFHLQTNHNPKPGGEERKSTLKSRAALPTILILAATISVPAWIWLGGNGQQRRLNPDTFVPFTITAREQVSPTAFILTVRPTDCIKNGSSSEAAALQQFDSIWDKGATWSVEVKQPMLQVARDYTPLPRIVAEDEAEEVGAKPPELSFLIRKMDGGEVSTYLSGLGVGDQIELRGPHYGFDVRRRLGDAERVVFLAGGTGIAPALQVVKAVLELGGKEEKGEGEHGKMVEERARKVDIIWANRHRDDCRTCPGLGSVTGELEDGGSGGRMLEQLAQIQNKYPGRVTVRCTVDDERSFIDARAVAGLLTSGGKIKAGGGEEVRDCWLHSQEVVAWRPAMDADVAERESCCCGSGKNLLFVSGPEGFVEHFAGPKRWANGAELQGPVGGVLGKLRAQHPGAMRGWLVLKL